jgi:hypothetical protein
MPGMMPPLPDWPVFRLVFLSLLLSAKGFKLCRYLFNMINGLLESPKTLTLGYVSSSDNSVLEVDKSPVCRRARVGALSRGRVNKFDQALRKSLKARSRFLGRRLTRREFSALVASVRKQISRCVSDEVSRTLSRIVARVSALERACPTTMPQFEDGLAAARMQVDLLRREVVSCLDTNSVTETCAHIARRKVLTLEIESPLFVPLPKGNLFLERSVSRQTISCPTCTSSREDFFFSHSGSDWILFSGEQQKCFSASSARSLAGANIRPLSVQAIWTAFLSAYYDRVI